MEIIDITKDKKKYNIVLKNGDIIETNEDTIIQYYLRKGLNVDEKLYNNIIDTTNFYNYYGLAINYLNRSYKSSFKIRLYLKNNNCDEQIIDKIIDLLKERKLIDDYKYFELLASYYQRKNYGPFYIRNKGYEEFIDETIIENVMSSYSEFDFFNSIDKLIEKYIRTNKEKDDFKLKEKLKKYLYQRGFSLELIIKRVDLYYENR